MNFIKGTVRLGANPMLVTDSGVEVPLPDAQGVTDGQKVVYGLRPEHIRLDPNGVPAQVIVTEPTGSEILVVAHLGDGSRQETQEFTCLFRERLSFKPGEVIRIAPQPGLTHLFDEATGRRL